MIEPQSAQEGASAWEVKVTWALPMPRLPRVLRTPVAPLPADLALPLPLLAGVVEGEPVPGAATAVAGEEAAPRGAPDEPAPPLNGEACPAAPDEALPEVPAPPEPAAPEPPSPRVSGRTEDSAVADRSTRPSVARSSGGRKREPSQRKM